MHNPGQQQSAGDRPTTTISVLKSQNRAVDRRHSLAEQQRAYQATYPSPYILRRRPPT
jgi:hypothetical protein